MRLLRTSTSSSSILRFLHCSMMCTWLKRCHNRTRYAPQSLLANAFVRFATNPETSSSHFGYTRTSYPGQSIICGVHVTVVVCPNCILFTTCASVLGPESNLGCFSSERYERNKSYSDDCTQRVSTIHFLFGLLPPIIFPR